MRHKDIYILSTKYFCPRKKWKKTDSHGKEKCLGRRIIRNGNAGQIWRQKTQDQCASRKRIITDRKIALDTISQTVRLGHRLAGKREQTRLLSHCNSMAPYIRHTKMSDANSSTLNQIILLHSLRALIADNLRFPKLSYPGQALEFLKYRSRRYEEWMSTGRICSTFL